MLFFSSYICSTLAHTAIAKSYTHNKINPVIYFVQHFCKAFLYVTVQPLEGRARCNYANLPVINGDRLKTAKALVDKAIKVRHLKS